MTGKPTPRIIFLNGADTGLKAHTVNDAIAVMLRVLHRRGHHSATEAVLKKGYRGERGRVDFTWPPA